MRKKLRIRVFVVAILLLCLIPGSIALAYSAIICHGEAPNPDDCGKFYRKVRDQAGYAVKAVGFTVTGTGQNEREPRAARADLKNARNYDVLYWSSHGGYSANNAYVYGTDKINVHTAINESGGWRGDYKIKVALFGACYTFQNPTIRSKWVDVMRNTRVRALAGFHETASSDRDAEMIREFFKRVNQDYTLRTAWAEASKAVSNNNWLIMTYYGGEQAKLSSARVFRFQRLTVSPDRKHSNLSIQQCPS